MTISRDHPDLDIRIEMQRNGFRNAPCCVHAAQVYARRSDLIDAVERFVDGAIDRGEACLLAATRRHMHLLERRLVRAGRDSEALRASGQLTWLDARETLDAIMDVREPNAEAFHRIIRAVIERLRSRFAGLSVFGELVDLLWKQENHRAADRLERWWNDLIAEYGFTLLCGYHANVFDERVQHGLDRICREHTHFLPGVEEGRFEESIDAAMRELIPDGDVHAMRRSLIPQCPHTAAMPDGQSMLFALRDVLPPLAHDLRIRARRHYLRMDEYR